MQKRSFFALALLLQLMVTLGLGIRVAYGNSSDMSPSGLIVCGQEISGLSKSQVFIHLKNVLPNAVSYNAQVYPLKMDRSYEEIELWLDKVLPVANGSWFSVVLQNLTRPSISISANNVCLNKDEIITQLQSLSNTINKPMCPATIAYSNGQLLMTDGQAGRVLDIEGTWLKMSQEHKRKQVEAIVKVVPALPELKDLSKTKSVLGDYTTYFNSQDLPRMNNLRLATSALNNHLIPPGQVFSFNDVVGQRTEAAGYLPALIFDGQSVIRGDGGGICQDSSTLYQAVRQAHLTIIEKHTHSLPVSYVPKGQDATVSYGILDFRFRNDSQGFLLISAITGTDWVRIRLFGLADDTHPAFLKPESYPILAK